MMTPIRSRRRAEAILAEIRATYREMCKQAGVQSIQDIIDQWRQCKSRISVLEAALRRAEKALTFYRGAPTPNDGGFIASCALAEIEDALKLRELKDGC